MSSTVARSIGTARVGLSADGRNVDRVGDGRRASSTGAGASGGSREHGDAPCFRRLASRDRREDLLPGLTPPWSLRSECFPGAGVAFLRGPGMKLGGTGSSPVLLSLTGGPPRVSGRRRDMPRDRAPAAAPDRCEPGVDRAAMEPERVGGLRRRHVDQRQRDIPAGRRQTPREAAGHRGRSPNASSGARATAACSAADFRQGFGERQRLVVAATLGRRVEVDPRRARPAGVRSARPAWRCGSPERDRQTSRTEARAGSNLSARADEVETQVLLDVVGVHAGHGA